MPWRRRRYPRYNPYGRGGWGPGPGYGYRPGGSCLRDACLLETGCCIAEALDGDCLLTALLLLPQFVRAVATTPGGHGGPRGGSRAADSIVDAVRVYQREVSPRRPPVCRFTPSCSEYTAQALARHGALRGTRLAAIRVLRCRPGGRRGADPVPR
jgi:uncharacterized protein